MVHLHIHSMLSLRDSIIKPEDMVKRLKEIGQDTIAITDHGSSLGGVSIYKLLKENDIKYIHGCEFYICDDVKVKDKDNKYYHLVVLCKNETGRLNMNRLITLSNRPENKYSKPRIDFEMLSLYGDGLIVLSACLAGEISKNLMRGETQKAEEIALKYKRRFGNDYFLEIQSRLDNYQVKVNKQIKSLADKLGIECVVTTDAHYTYKEDQKYQNKYAFNGNYKEDGESYIDCYIQSELEVREKLDYFEDTFIDTVITNTEKIASKCNVEIPLSAPIMPHVDTPAEYQSNKEWLITLCRNGFREKLNIDLDSFTTYDETRTKDLYDKEDGHYIGTVPWIYTKDGIQTYVDRYNYELNSLDKMGFIDYILLVYSYANVADRRGIARGSGGGSLINFVTNITDIDPIEHGLYFERFIDVGALDLLESGEITANELKIPDIDLDFSGECCNEVLKYLYNKYGEDRVASIGKFGTNQTKGTIRDMCKVLDIDLQTADNISKSFANYEIDDIDNMISGAIPKEKDANEAIYYVETYTELFDYVRKLNGLPKSFGLHACGKIVGTKDLDYFLPSCYDKDGIRYLQGDMHDVEDVGLVKIDVLGLRTLDQEYDTLEMSGESKDFINPKQSYHDPKVLDIFRNGDTVGVFQMASPGMRKTLKKMNVSGIDDISIANALFRPGAMAYIDDFCKRRNKEEEFEYLHPDLEPILKDTYGIIVFQEQLIEIGRLAGMRNPDLLRKATGKKNPKLLNQVKPELEEKLKARGWTDTQFNKLWEDMLAFARYSFNKAHSSAYGIIAYMTAKQKAYYPTEFYAGLCNSYIGKSSFVKDNAQEIIEDAEKHNVIMKCFNYKQDHRKCSVKDGAILYGIPLIKDCNEEMGQALYRVGNMGLKSFFDVVKSLMNLGVGKKQIEILIRLDFFTDFGNSNELLHMLSMYESMKFGVAKQISKEKAEKLKISSIIPNYANDKNKDGSVGKNYKITDIDGLISALESAIKFAQYSDIPYKEKIKYQKEMLGFINLTTNKREDVRKLIITNIFPLIGKWSEEPWAYRIQTKSVGTGKSAALTVKPFVYKESPLEKMDIIYARQLEKNSKGYWYLWEYKKVG